MNPDSAASPRLRIPAFQQWGPLGVLSGGIFAIDLLFPLGVATGALYLIVILLSLRQKNSQLTLWSALTCSILTIIAVFFSPIGGELWKTLVNRALTLFVIWTTTVMGRIQMQQAGTIQRQDQTTRAFIRTFPAACFSFDRHGVILSWNPAAEDIYGYTEQEAIGTSIYDLIVTPETLSQTQKVIDDIFRGETAGNQIWHDQNKQRVYGWRMGSLFPVFDDDGQVAYGVNCNVNITDQKNAEAELQEKHALFEAILNSSKDAIYAKDLSGKYLLANQTAADVMGKSPDDLIGLNDVQVFGHEYGKKLQQTDSKILTNNRNIQLEETILKEGFPLTFSTTKSPLKTLDGTTIGLVGISRDITEWKKNQTDLLLTERVFMASNDHISILGRDYRYRRVNPSYEKVHMNNSQEVVGMSVSELLGQEVFEQTIKTKLDECFQGKEVHYEGWFQFASNQDHYMVVSYLPLMSTTNDINEIVVIARDWTERKQMVERLKANQQQLRVILDAMTNFVGIGTADGTITDCNQAPLTLAGLTRDDVIGKRFVDTDWLNYSPKAQEQVRAIIQRVSQGEIVREDYQASMGNNGIVTVDACFVPIKDAEGQVQQIVHSGIDVTERRQAETALHASEEQFRDLYESAPLAYFSASWDGYITRVNSRASEILGYSQQELNGKQVLTLYASTKDGHEKASTIQTKTQEGIAVHDEELEMIKKDGTTLSVSLTVRLIFDDDGKIIERRGMVQDISDRKKVESELRASEYRFRTYFETGLVGMAITSLQKEWLEVNDRLCSILGYPREELQQKTWDELTYPDDLPLDEIKFKRLLDGTRDSYSMEKRYIRKDGALIFTNIFVHAIRKSSGAIDYFTAMVEDVTERKQAELALAESQNRFQAIFDDAGIGMALANIHGHFVESNRSFQAFLGYTAEELHALSFNVVTHQEDVATNQDFFEELKKGIRDSFNMEKRYIRKDGNVVWGHLTVTTIRHANGELQFAIGMIEDITKKKQSEASLTKWATIFQHTQWGVAVGGPDSHQLDLVNEAYARMHGYSIEELQGQPIVQVFAPSFRPQLPAFIQKIHEEGSQSIESLHIRKDGSTFPALLTVSAVKDSEGIVLYRVANLIDISDRKIAVEALRESEQKYRIMFEQAAVGVAQISSKTGQFIKINQRFCNIVGYSQEEMITKTFQILTHPDDLITGWKNMTRMVSGEIRSFSMEKRYYHKDGHLVWCNLSVAPMWQSDEEPSFHISVVEDITERKLLEEAIRKHNEELEMKVEQRTQRIQELEQRRMHVEKLAALAQIAAGVAHEINNPLASISQSLVLLERALSKDHPHYGYMAKTEDCVQRIAAITKNLYQLYRPSGPMPTLVNIRKCIQTATEIMEERSIKHGVRITGPSDSTPMMTRVAQSELIQVLCNLIHNAIDASAEGDTIDMSLTTESKAIHISIADQGTGIPAEAAAHIFEPFYTTKQNGSEGGMGLGLSISHSMIESMKGSLKFSTTLGQGSTFVITLPHT